MNRNYYPSLVNASESTPEIMVLFGVQFKNQFKKDVKKQDRGTQRAVEMINSLKHMTCEEILKKLGLAKPGNEENKGRSDNNLKLPGGKDH